MLQLTGYGVRNLRALKNTEIVDLKPITILVGKNSAGKSTFARILPLLKQSVERRKQSPLLWFGRLVDFGSFEDALSSFADNSNIELLLRFESQEGVLTDRRGRNFFYKPSDDGQPLEPTKIDVRIKLGAEGDEKRTTWEEVFIEIGDLSLSINRSSGAEASISVNNAPITVPTDTALFWSLSSLFPSIRPFFKENKTRNSLADIYYGRGVGALIGSKEMFSAISNFVHGNTADDKKEEIAERLPIVSSPALLIRYCKSLPTAPESWRSSFSSNYISPLNVKRLMAATLVYKFDQLFDALDDAINTFCAGVSYLEPLRATAQRYYRQEEVSIDELDPKGLNTAFYFQGLTVREKENLNSWLKDAFGFTLSLKTFSGHVTLNVTSALGGPPRNLADVGLGYSQLIPVAIQLWAASRISPNRSAVLRARGVQLPQLKSLSSVVVIEQPELHLHPAYQAQLAKVFARVVSKQSAGQSHFATKILAETHSVNLVNKLGELIGTGQLDSKDVQILVFDQEQSEEGATKITVAVFDNEGILQNWPIGFFDY